MAPANPDALLCPLVEHAIELAAQWHDGTYRKGTWREAAFDVPDDAHVQTPAMAHATAVASIVRRAGWGDDAIAAAYLHDALEDANRHGAHLRREQMHDAVGPDVTRLVAFVSEEKYDADGAERPWDARKEGYVEQIRTALPEAVAVSLADKLHNLWSMNQALQSGEAIFTPGPNRTALSAGPDRQRAFYHAVLDASTSADDPRLEPMRTRLHDELRRFSDLASHLDDA